MNDDQAIVADLLTHIAALDSRVRRLHWWLLSQSILLVALTVTVWK